MSWTDEKVNKLKELWGKGNTASQIAEIIGGISRYSFELFKSISKNNEFEHNSYQGKITSVIFSGTHTRYKINVNNVHLECSLQSVGIDNIKEADQVFVHLPKDKIWGMND